MTALSVFSALIGILIYPYVIRMTGKEAYGTYVYAFTIASIFQVIMDFGIDSPCTKSVVLARDDIQEQSRIVSNVLFLKSLIVLLCGAVLFIGLYTIPFMQHNRLICLFTFIQASATSFFPVWYFQGLKKMKFVTYINLGLRLCTIPFIIWLIRSSEDIGTYAFIVMLSIVIGTILSYIILLMEGIRLRSVEMKNITSLAKDSFPFFLTSITGSVKTMGIKAIIKHAFGIGEVAIYDLAEKIVTIPRFFTQNINVALFPEVMANSATNRVQRIIRYERIIGIICMLFTCIISYPAVLFFGGEQMTGATIITILLSANIYTWLVAGAYINFVFIPSGRYYLITQNQLLAFISCMLLSIGGIYVYHHPMMAAAGLMLSGFIEVLYCRYKSRSIL